MAASSMSLVPITDSNRLTTLDTSSLPRVGDVGGEGTKVMGVWGEHTYNKEF